jgi:hypothetical protein
MSHTEQWIIVLTFFLTFAALCSSLEKRLIEIRDLLREIRYNTADKSRY